MPVYEYTALDRSGKNVKGIVDADSSLAARQKLRGSGVYPVEVREASGRPREAATGTPSVSTLFKRVGSGELAATTRQMSILLGAGVTLVPALDTLIGQITNPLLKRIMAQVKESVNEGNSLAYALSQHPKAFSQIYVNMVRAGEASGSLDLVLDRLAEYGEHQQALRGRFRAALAYPVFMLFIGTGILFCLVTFIVPNITGIFEEMHQTLPLITVALIKAGNFLKSFWWLVLGGAAACILVLKQFVRTQRGRFMWDEIKLRTPIMGGIHIKMAMARFGRTLGSLLQSGVPVLSAMKIVRNIVNNALIAQTVDRAIEEIEAGKGLAAPLSRSRWFPAMVIQMISVGEQSGELEKMLHKVADVYEREAESRILALTSMLEPVMILGMGLAVGFIVISILLPIFEMNQMIR